MRLRGTDAYELRVDSWMSIVFKHPASHVIPGLARWCAYAADADCELDEWEDRANADY